MKKTDLIALLQAMADNSRHVSSEMEKDGEKTFARQLMCEVSALENVVMILERPNYAKKLFEIYFPGKEI